MSEILRVLHQEHTNIGKLLKVLERRVAELEAAEAGHLELIRDILDYFQNFPDACHHPKEDLVLERLKVRDPAAAEPAKGLGDEHAALAGLTDRFAASVDRMLADETIARDAVRAEANEFIQAYWRHMRLEEEHFFPAARRALTDQDWQDIAVELADPEDPLFSDRTAERYWRLRYEIFEADGAT